jgi:hypothetical protein
MMFFKKATTKIFDHDAANEQFQKFILDGYLASALQLADEAASLSINSPRHAFWIGNKAFVYVKSGDYLKVKMSAEMAMFLAGQLNDAGSLWTRMVISELMILFPSSYEDLESKIEALAQLNPDSATLTTARITLSGRETGKPFHEMLKMYICSQISETMTADQKSMLACQWGFSICHSQDLEFPMELYREAVKIFTELQHQAAYAARMKLIANGKHDPEEYLMILRPAILAVNIYARLYPYDMEIVNIRDEMFFYYSIFGDTRSTSDLVVKFDLLNQPLQICRSCGLPLIKRSQICWNCGSSI